MYKLLIVDDEYQARIGLRDLVDWAELGIEVVGDAEDGDVALELLAQCRPDILLTDVRMNRMDGLTLAREARSRLPGLEIVFISGYSDAEYLRGALRVEAYDYLYKPVRIRELREIMARLTDRLDARESTRRQLERSRLLLEKSRPLLMERLMHSWIAGMLEDEKTIRARLELVDLTLPAGGGFIAAALQPEWPAFPSGGQAEAYLVLLEGIVRECFPDALLCAEETGLIALLPLGGEPGLSAAQEALSAVADRMRGVTEATLLIGISAWHAKWTHVPQAVREAQEALELGVTQDTEAVLRYERGQAAPTPALSPLDTGLLERSLATGSFEPLWSGIEEQLAGLLPGGDADAARRLLMDYALRADLVLLRLGLPGIDALAFCRQALAHRSVAPVRGALRSALREACGRAAQRAQAGAGSGSATARVLEIIRRRYAQRLTVEALAEEVHYSPAHLSTLFRQETGMTIGEALFQTRMRAAMELLGTVRAPISTVAQESGYTDVQYFSRVFKRFAGMTPMEYRKRVSP